MLEEILNEINTAIKELSAEGIECYFNQKVTIVEN